MAKISKRDKQQIIKDFEMMKEFESNAHDLYEQIASSPAVEHGEVIINFQKIAKDEKAHAALVQNIIDIVEKL